VERNCIGDKVLLLAGCGSGAGVEQSGMLPVVMCKAGKGEFNPLQT